MGLILLAGCDPGGSQGRLSTPDGPSAQAEQQVIQSLLGLYREAVISEPVTVTIGLDATLVTEITDNNGAGIALEDSDGSMVQIDSRQTVFDNNAAGDLVGPIVDVATP